jgi:hypothetical protein
MVIAIDADWEAARPNMECLVAVLCVVLLLLIKH